MVFNARVMTSRDCDELADEMTNIGAEWPGVVRMVPKAVGHVIKLHGVRTPAAIILKEEMLSKGGDSAIHRDCITNKIERSDVLLMGSEAVFMKVADSLTEQPFSLPTIASEITSAIEYYKNQAPITPQAENLSYELRELYENLRNRTIIMGILNITPDSFSDGGLHADVESAVARALSMVEEGADIIDIGGESSRPGAAPVSVDAELERVIPVIENLAKKRSVPISIDSCKHEVAARALDAGARVIDDITGLADEAMKRLAVERKAASIIMHMKGTPRTMQENPVYDDLISQIMAFFRKRIGEIVEAGLPEEYIIIDPGIGFGKTAQHNLEIIRKLADFKSIGRPILIGASRKAFIGKYSGDLPTEERLEGTAAAVAVSIANGANIVRVHDVKEMARVARMADALTV